MPAARYAAQLLDSVPLSDDGSFAAAVGDSSTPAAGTPAAAASAFAIAAAAGAPAPLPPPPPPPQRFAGAAQLLQPADSLPQPDLGPASRPPSPWTQLQSLLQPSSDAVGTVGGAGTAASPAALISVPIRSTAEYQQLSGSAKERLHQVGSGGWQGACSACCALAGHFTGAPCAGYLHA